MENGRTLPFAIEEVERLSNLGALVLGEREQRGLLGLRRHHAQRLEREGETEAEGRQIMFINENMVPRAVSRSDSHPRGRAGGRGHGDH